MSLIADNPSNDEPNPSAGNPKPGEADPSPASSPKPGEPDPNADRQTMGALLEKRVQGVVDQNIHYLQSGETAKMNPKIVELLTTYDGLLTQARQGAQVDTDEDGLLKPKKLAQNGGEGGDPSDAELGRKTRLKGAHDQVMETAEQQVLADIWLDDAKSFYAELKDTEVTTEEFETVDILNTKLFPRNKAGYRKWQGAANALRVKYPSQGSGDTDEDSDVDTDRDAAGKTKKPPTLSGSRSGIKTLAQAARMKREGKLSDVDYLKEVARFSQV